MIPNNEKRKSLKGNSTKSTFHLGLIGWFPPPLGGVSVHIQRLKRALDNIGIDYLVYDVSSTIKKEKGVVPVYNFRKWVFAQLVSTSNDRSIIHNHLISWKQRALPLLLKLRGSKVIFTFHSLREEIIHDNLVNTLCMKMVLHWGDHFIAVASQIQDKLICRGVNPLKITVIPAFIPPQVNPQDTQQIPDNIHNFINSHKPVISANASRIGFFQGIDLYGMDLCLLLTCRLKVEYPDIGFVFCLPGAGKEEYFISLLNQLVALGLSDNFLFVTEQMDFFPILEKSDLFVRPTNTEGDSISIREALYFNKPVVCSELPDRPDGVILFNNRDLDDFVRKTRQVIANLKFHDKQYFGLMEANNSYHQNVEKILNVYQKILNTD